MDTYMSTDLFFFSFVRFMLDFSRIRIRIRINCLAVQGATEVLLKFGMGVEIDATTDGMKVNNERGGPSGSNPAEEAHALMNGTPLPNNMSPLRAHSPILWCCSRFSL